MSNFPFNWLALERPIPECAYTQFRVIQLLSVAQPQRTLCLCGPTVISGERCDFSNSQSLPSIQFGVRAQGHFINVAPSDA